MTIPKALSGAERYFQVLLGVIIAVVGIGLLIFAITLVYADIIHNLPSKLAINFMIGVCAILGMFFSLVGARLVSGRPSPADRLLLSRTAWRIIGMGFIGVALLLAIRGRFGFGLFALAFGILCFNLKWANSPSRHAQPSPWTLNKKS